MRLRFKSVENWAAAQGWYLALRWGCFQNRTCSFPGKIFRESVLPPLPSHMWNRAPSPLWCTGFWGSLVVYGEEGTLPEGYALFSKPQLSFWLLFSYPRLFQRQVWWCTSVIPALGRWQEEDQEFKASLSHMSPCLKIKPKRGFHSSENGAGTGVH